MSEKRDNAVRGVPTRIDVHHHAVPPEYLKALADAGVTASMGMRFPEWSVEKVLEMMHSNGIQTSVTSVTTPAANVKDAKAARAIARLCNEVAAKMISDHPGRFGAFATVPPLTDVEGALAEIEYALDTLKLDGVALMTNYDLRYLGDGLFEEIFRDMNRRKALVHVHPSDPPGVQFGVPGGLMDAPFDTTRAVTNLICTGTMERYPNINYILSHGGGTLPYLVHRIAEGVPFMWKGFIENAPKGFEHYLKSMYFDTALVGPHAYPTLLSMAGVSHILFGTDSPFAPSPVIMKTTKVYEAFLAADPKKRNVIEKENALLLLPRLREYGNL
jgi:predicted TIM-barrel fold metal-dependent hydrolase